MDPSTLLFVAAFGVTAQPIRPHPENPRYFLFQGKPTVLVTSGEHYGAVLNREFDFVRRMLWRQSDDSMCRRHGFCQEHCGFHSRRHWFW
jgi:hypothetical protein